MMQPFMTLKDLCYFFALKSCKSVYDKFFLRDLALTRKSNLKFIQENRTWNGLRANRNNVYWATLEHLKSSFRIGRFPSVIGGNVTGFPNGEIMFENQWSAWYPRIHQISVRTGRSSGFSNIIFPSGRPVRNSPVDLWFPLCCSKVHLLISRKWFRW